MSPVDYGFEPSLTRTLVYEGGKANNPKDPGGRTMRGVTQRVYDAYRRRRGLAVQDVWLIATDELQAIYRAQYWNVIRGDDLPAGIGFAVFDGAVNSGCAQSAKWLQRALGLRADGVIGEKTIQVACDYVDHDALIAKIEALRLQFLKNLKTWSDFGKGWGARVEQVRIAGQAWATGSVGPDPTYVDGAHAKARLEDAKSSPSTAPGNMTAGAGLMTTAISPVIDNATATLQPIAETSNSHLLTTILTGLVVLGVIVSIIGLAWSAYAMLKGHKRKVDLDLTHGDDDATDPTDLQLVSEA